MKKKVTFLEVRREPIVCDPLPPVSNITIFHVSLVYLVCVVVEGGGYLLENIPWKIFSNSMKNVR
jgi:hypothetical protein